MAFPDTQLSTPYFASGYQTVPGMDSKVTGPLNLLAARVADTGWQDLSLASGVSNTGTYNAAARKIGSIVYLRGQITKTSGNWDNTSYVTLANLPSASYSPDAFVRLFAPDVASATASGVLLEISNGATAIQVASLGNMNNNVFLNGLSFITD